MPVFRLFVFHNQKKVGITLIFGYGNILRKITLFQVSNRFSLPHPISWI